MEKIRTEHISFTYPEAQTCALSDISLTIEQGSYTALIGRSGSGKTTLLRLLKPCLTPTGRIEGQILIEGKDIASLPFSEQSKKIGYVMQNPDSQIVTDTVRNELAFGLENFGLDSDTIRRRCAETAAYFGITSWFDSCTDNLSGGQKQLLNLASVMVTDPEILLLDEPVSQLDPIAAESFLHTVKKINKELGVTVLITEHRLEEIFEEADRILVIDNGHIVSDAPPEEICKKADILPDFVRYALPASAQVYAACGTDDAQCPLTVGEGRSWLQKTVPTAAYTRIDREENAAVPTAIAAKNISFQYEKNGKRILDCVSVDFQQGKITAITGGNGAGKTTLLKILSGLVKPLTGKVKNGGKKAAYLPQNVSAVFSEDTVKADLELISKDIDSVVRLTGIADILHKHPFDISGGEMQKAAAAKLLLTDPDIVLLDEPTKGLDSGFKREFAAILKEIAKSGKTVIIVSHDIAFCAAYTDICMMLFGGKIVSNSPTRAFFCGNASYTTAAHRMSRTVFENAVTAEEVIQLCKKNQAL